MTLLQLVVLIEIICAGVTAGGLVMVARVLVLILRRYPPSTSLQLHREVDRHCDRYLRPSTAISGLAAVSTMFLQDGVRRQSTVLTLVGVAGTLGVVVTSEFFNIPINRRFSTWTAEPVPADYGRLRRQWDWFNLMRTVLSLVALTCYTIAGLTCR